MKSAIKNQKSNIIIAGAGPAGASLAIRLAKENFKVCLIEREKFPRPKLCGEFISPECLTHFRALGVLDEMLAIGGDRISETVFYAPNGKSVGVSSKWFGATATYLQSALSISRAEMDFRLLEKAKQAGVEVWEEAQTIGLLIEKNEVCGIKVKNKNGQTQEISADLIVDATGRANVLASLVKRFKVQNSKFKAQNRKIKNPKSKIQNPLVGFKTHVQNANLEKGRCEIYFFRGGYGGLSHVENNLANHCFLIKAGLVKEFSGNADQIVEKVIYENKRAYETLKDTAPIHDWLAVSIDGFGAKNLNPARNLFCVGDAAAFIDPFTGSGMLMALESAEILASVITKNHFSPEKIAFAYEYLHKRKFRKRLSVCGLMRRAAFVPNAAKYVISALSYSEKAREILARATRQSLSIRSDKF